MPEFAFLNAGHFSRRLLSFVLVFVACVLALGGHVRAQDATPEATPLPSLAEQLGFDDPTLDGLEAQAQEPLFLQDTLNFAAYGRLYRLVEIWNVKETDIYYDGPPFGGHGTLLLYQIDLPQPKLIWRDSFTRYEVPYLPDVVNDPLPGDWGHNGEIEFGVHGRAADMTHADNLIFVFTLLKDNSVVSTLADVIPPGYFVFDIERQTNGELFLDAINVSLEGQVECYLCGPTIHRTFAWEKGKLVDISLKYISNYYSIIGGLVTELMTNLVDSKDSNLSDDNEFYLSIMELYKNYEVIGQKEVGWRLIQLLVTQAWLDGRLNDPYWTNEFLLALKEQYDKDGSIGPSINYNYYLPRS